MHQIIDLSQEIYSGMPVFNGLPEVNFSVHATHEQWEGLENATTATPSVLRLEMGEHTGTHVDALSHMGRAYVGQSIDTMPLSMFYTEGVCLDFSQKQLRELITAEELEAECTQQLVDIRPGDTVLLYTDHYRRCFGTEDWKNGPGITAEAARWLGAKKIAAFGVETMSPGVPKVSNREVHQICGEMGFIHYENMINLHLLIGRGRFRFIALPLKIRGGTGSPVRAVAVFDLRFKIT
ncbi:MAG: cyclase family protein [Saprospiraceae bacterium]|nr:cyclase family protein [Saprospiraceae bacterium]